MNDYFNERMADRLATLGLSVYSTVEQERERLRRPSAILYSTQRLV